MPFNSLSSGASSTVNHAGIEHFQKSAAQWWDESGPYRLLHALNPVRLRYLQDAFQKHIPAVKTPASLKILDIGCGGGLLCAPLARQGYDVTGIDACVENIQTARTYAEAHDLKITYYGTDFETWTTQHPDLSFDVILLMEILEHVPHPSTMIARALTRLKPGGLIFFATLNRSWWARVMAIGVAEFVLRWVPAGTHQWASFLRPSEILQDLTQNSIQPLDLTGVVYNPLTQKWSLNPSFLKINYMGYGIRL